MRSGSGALSTRGTNLIDRAHRYLRVIAETKAQKEHQVQPPSGLTIFTHHHR